MGVHMDEGEMASLEPQLQKIFKKQLGFFDDEVLSSTLKLINKVMFPLLFRFFYLKATHLKNVRAILPIRIVLMRAGIRVNKIKKIKKIIQCVGLK